MKYCVIGLGQFGTALAKELASLGHEVLALDNRKQPVEGVKDEVSVAVVADASDIEALREMGAHEVDAAVICIGEGFESSLMALSHMKEFGIEKIYCRVVNPVHKHLIDLLDVTERIQPEAEAATQFAKRLGIESAKQHFNLTGDFVIVEVEVPDRFIGKRLADVELRKEDNLNLVTIRAQGENQDNENGEDEENGAEDPAGILGVPDPDRTFEKGDYLVVFGREEDIESFSEK